MATRIALNAAYEKVTRALEGLNLWEAEYVLARAKASYLKLELRGNE